ncbi:MAG: oligosaccharide flippase family protein [Dysgonamonadaceae bacterium]|jgi:O-antigen/teichoic acid export membrane protein|nr:oligosaccharide flippase family protein [Dysgonamonadaceae bacterium]
MGGLKSLAKDTVLYGVSSILGRILNWLLTPLFISILATKAEYGIVTNLYSYVAIIMVILTFGMETGLFRFANQKDKYNPATVYSTTLISVGTVVLLFFILVTIFIRPVTDWIGEGEIRVAYVRMMLWILCLDAFGCIPFAYLRLKQRPLKFAALKMLQIILNIVFCLFFLVVCPYIYKNFPEWIDWFYESDYQVGYIFISNLLATFIQTCFLLSELAGFKYRLDIALLKKMLRYSLPLLVLGVAGMMNQTIDKIIFPKMYSGLSDGFSELGEYGACFKLAIIMVMFTQAFRYAFEPFIFSRNNKAGHRQSYADATKYFIILGLLVFLCVSFYLDILKYFIPNRNYWDGLKIVPIVLMGELFFGIYFNLSLWYKLTDQTRWGAILSILGCAIIVLINVLFIPHYGYMACAWASFIGNLAIMSVSYFMGQKKYPIPYDLKSVGLYFALALILYSAAILLPVENQYLRWLYRAFLICIYLVVLIKRDLPLKEIPYLNKILRR